MYVRFNYCLAMNDTHVFSQWHTREEMWDHHLVGWGAGKLQSKFIFFKKCHFNLPLWYIFCILHTSHLKQAPLTEVLQSLIELIYSNWLLFVSFLWRVTLEGCDARRGNGPCFVPPRVTRWWCSQACWRGVLRMFSDFNNIYHNRPLLKAAG